LPLLTPEVLLENEGREILLPSLSADN